MVDEFCNNQIYLYLCKCVYDNTLFITDKITLMINYHYSSRDGNKTFHVYYEGFENEHLDMFYDVSEDEKYNILTTIEKGERVEFLHYSRDIKYFHITETDTYYSKEVDSSDNFHTNYIKVPKEYHGVYYECYYHGTHFIVQLVNYDEQGVIDVLEKIKNTLKTKGKKVTFSKMEK